MKLSESQRKTLALIIRERKNSDEVLRAQAVLMLSDAMPLQTITAVTGFKRRHIFSLCAQFAIRGEEVFRDKRKGKPKELLSKRHKDELITTLQTKTPQDLGYVYAFWTSSLLADYVERMYGVKYRLSSTRFLRHKVLDFL